MANARVFHQVLRNRYHLSRVARSEPAPLGEGLAGRLLSAPVLRKQIVAPDQELAYRGAGEATGLY